MPLGIRGRKKACFHEVHAMKSVRLLSLAMVVFAVLVAGAASAAEADWKQWRGPNRDGKSADTGLLKSWPKGGPKKLWEVKGIGNGYSSITLDGGLAYITGRKPHADEKIEYERPTKHIWQIKGQGFYVSTIDIATGKVKQSKDVANAYYEKIHPDGRRENLSYKGTRASITIDGDHLYVATGLGEILCLKKDTFERVWSRKVQEKEFDSGIVGHGWGYCESVLVYKDKAVYCTGGETTFMVAFDKMTGKTLWKSPPNGQSQYGSTILADVDGVPVLINGSRVGLMGVHAETGKGLWTYEFAKKNTANCNTPIYSDGFVFWPCGYGKGGICLKLTAKGQEVTATKAWYARGADCHHGGMILHDGYVYGNHRAGFTCIDFKTGKTMWDSNKAEKDGEKIPKGSTCWADGMFYVFAENAGEMFLVEADPKGYKIKGHFFAEGFEDKSGWTKEHGRTMGTSWAHPVVAGGRLYLRHFNKVYCYDVTKK
jgi:outer membrane protein assembly factor BamB